MEGYTATAAAWSRPMSAPRSTIFALSSGHGPAGVAVVRISGPAAAEVLQRMAAPLPDVRLAALRRIRHPATGELLDEALVLYFRAPRSETGEDIAELHLHGSPAVVRAVLAALATIPTCRLAEPGEFARRAFENGKLDLTAAEGLSDLIDAETDAQRRQALALAGGAFRRLCDTWAARLVEARSLAEAAIDFSDEPDVADDAQARARTMTAAILQELEAHQASANLGEIVRDGFRVVLAGPPNAGKSSLLNALAQRDVAIVSPEAGTTRDVLEARLDLGGFAVVVADTAGLRDDPAGPVEQEGIRRTLARTGSADLILWLVDATAPRWHPPASVLEAAVPVWIVLNKIDRASPAPAHDVIEPPARAGLGPQPPTVCISALTGAGLPDLIALLAAEVACRLDGGAGPAIPLRVRHRQALADTRDALTRSLAPGALPELMAEDLRLAANALGRITGRVDAEQVLDLIFSRFCIGK
jgi:tRNA modification GTPase